MFFQSKLLSNKYSKLLTGLLMFAGVTAVSLPASAACVTASTEVGYEAEVTWMNVFNGNRLKSASLSAGQTVCSRGLIQDKAAIFIQTMGAPLGKRVVVAMGDNKLTSGILVGCKESVGGCAVSKNMGAHAFQALLDMPHKDTLIYARTPSKTFVCLSGSEHNPQVSEWNNRGRHECPN